MAEKLLFDELRSAVSTFICQPGVSVELENVNSSRQIFTKGGSQAVCTVKLDHGQVYNVEFVYKFWVYLLENTNFPYSPLFIISNNGLALTLKCFLSEPRETIGVSERVQPMSSDVDLVRNSSVVMGDDDFVKFKSAMVYNSDLDVFNSMVVCRTYITERRQSLQFFVVKPKNQQRLQNVLDLINVSSRCRHPLAGPGTTSQFSSILGCPATLRRPLRNRRTSSGSSCSSFARLDSCSDSDSSLDREDQYTDLNKNLVRQSRKSQKKIWKCPKWSSLSWKIQFSLLLLVSGPLLVMSVYRGMRYFLS